MSKPRPPLEEMTLRQLRKIASVLHISRYSRMRKAQLLKAIQIKKKNLQSDTIIDSPIKKKLLKSINTNNLINKENFTDLLGLKNVASEDKEKKYPTNPIEDNFSSDWLTDVDDELGELPQWYGEKKIVLMATDPQWAYAYWDISPEEKDKLRQQGGINLSLRLYDVTGIDSDYKKTGNSLEYICNESAHDWYIPIPSSDRDYYVEIGYRCIDGKWLSLARSEPVHIPSLYPSDWEEDIFVSVPWEKPLTSEKISILPSNNVRRLKRKSKLLFSSFASRVDGSLYGKFDHIPGSISFINPVSSYQFASGGSGIGMWSSGSGLMSGIGMWASGAGLMSGIGMWSSGAGLMSGAGMWASGAGLMSGAGLSRQFWLMANAKLTIYGATVPNAKVTISNQEIELDTDGTFRFQVSFPDGVIDCPIVAVSADGEETRSIEMKFDRQTNFSQPEVEEASKNLAQEEQTSSIQKTINAQTNLSATDDEQDDNTSDRFPPIDSTDDNRDDNASDWFPPVDSTDNEDDISDWFPPIRP